MRWYILLMVTFAVSGFTLSACKRKMEGRWEYRGMPQVVSTCKYVDRYSQMCIASGKLYMCIEASSGFDCAPMSLLSQPLAEQPQ